MRSHELIHFNDELNQVIKKHEDRKPSPQVIPALETFFKHEDILSDSKNSSADIKFQPQVIHALETFDDLSDYVVVHDDIKSEPPDIPAVETCHSVSAFDDHSNYVAPTEPVPYDNSNLSSAKQYTIVVTDPSCDAGTNVRIFNNNVSCSDVHHVNISKKTEFCSADTQTENNFSTINVSSVSTQTSDDTEVDRFCSALNVFVERRNRQLEEEDQDLNTLRGILPFYKQMVDKKKRMFVRKMTNLCMELLDEND